MPLGGTKGTKGTKGRLLLPQAWVNTGGEQMYRREKRSTELRRDQRGEKKRGRNQQQGRLWSGRNAHGLRKKGKEQDKYRAVAAV